MIIKPLFNNVLIELIKEKKMNSAIVLVDTASEKIGRGVVKEVGCGRFYPEIMKTRPISLKIGDCVLFNLQLAKEIVESGITYFLVSEDDIYCTIY